MVDAVVVVGVVVVVAVGVFDGLNRAALMMMMMRRIGFVLCVVDDGMQLLVVVVVVVIRDSRSSGLCGAGVVILGRERDDACFGGESDRTCIGAFRTWVSCISTEFKREGLARPCRRTLSRARG